LISVVRIVQYILLISVLGAPPVADAHVGVPMVVLFNTLDSYTVLFIIVSDGETEHISALVEHFSLAHLGKECGQQEQLVHCTAHSLTGLSKILSKTGRDDRL
jgi:flagellar biosynthesis protein FliR